jgi:hypothetical protein
MEDLDFGFQFPAYVHGFFVSSVVTGHLSALAFLVEEHGEIILQCINWHWPVGIL